MEDHDLEYAQNMISFIEAEDTSEREMKLETLEKWFEGKFYPFSTTRRGGQCCERFVQLANPKALTKVASASMENMEEMMSNSFGSFVVKKILTSMLTHLQDQSVQLSIGKKMKTWVQNFCEFCSDHIEAITGNDVSLLVLKHLLHLLGGLKTNKQILESKGKKRKRGSVEEPQKPIKVPKEFNEPFLGLIKKILGLIKNAEDWLQSTSTGTLLIVIFEVLHKKDPEEFKKQCKNFEQTFNPEGLWSSVHGSFLAEKIWSLSSEEYQQHLFETYLKDKFETLCSQEKANKALNVIIKDTKSSTLFKTICKLVCSSFEKIVVSNSGYLLVSLANGCVQHVKRQKDFMNALKDYLQCESKPKLLFPTILYLTKVEDYEKQVELQTSPYGTRIIQALWKFEKTNLLIESLQKLKMDKCVQLLCDSKAVYVFEEFLKSETIDPKVIKDISSKWISKVDQFAANKFGSHIFDVLWEKSDLETKEMILETLVGNEEALSKIPTYKFTKLKCKQNEYKYNKQKWIQLVSK